MGVGSSFQSLIANPLLTLDLLLQLHRLRMTEMRISYIGSINPRENTM